MLLSAAQVPVYGTVIVLLDVPKFDEAADAPVIVLHVVPEVLL